MDELVKFLEELAERDRQIVSFNTADSPVVRFSDRDRRRLRGVALILKGKRNVAVSAALRFALDNFDSLEDFPREEIATYLEGGDRPSPSDE